LYWLVHGDIKVYRRYNNVAKIIDGTSVSSFFANVAESSEDVEKNV